MAQFVTRIDDWLAKQVLVSINYENVGRGHLKTVLLGSDMTAWA